MGAPDGQDLPLAAGTEGIGCFGHTAKIGIGVRPQPCRTLARPLPQMKCQS